MRFDWDLVRGCCGCSNPDYDGFCVDCGKKFCDNCFNSKDEDDEEVEMKCFFI